MEEPSSLPELRRQNRDWESRTNKLDFVGRNVRKEEAALRKRFKHLQKFPSKFLAEY